MKRSSVPSHWARKVAGLALTGLALTSALAPSLAMATVDVPEAGGALKGERAPQEKPAPNSLEHGLWETADKAERAAKTSGERDFDPALNTHVRELTDKLAGPYGPDLRVYVMDRPFFNAQMAPNGYTEVWTGLMLRAETEDELAFVLGHELTHFRHNHSVESYRAMKARGDSAMAASLLLAVVGTAAAAGAGSYGAARDISNLTSGLINVVYLGSIASYFGFSRDNETEADRFSQSYVRAAGYDDLAGAHLWRTLLDETAASYIRKVRESPTRSNVFGSHPLEADRIVAIEAEHTRLTGTKAPVYDDAAHKPARAAYREKIRPYLAAWLKDDLRRQDFGQTLFTITRLKRDGLDQGLLNFYAGEAYRLKAKEARERDSDAKTAEIEKVRLQSLDEAVKAYRAALEFPDAPRETLRQLGDVYRRLGRKAEALEAWKAYIAANPAAADAWMISDQIATLEKEG
jgi:beta-barrel assembly-enhancing protease